ncbi:MAG: SDR family oxidoreductase [Acidimicrobiales bacterium]|jgi:NAD(P)-dependent dehydrogenase (short-subunit alcohol dehydrogenase family)|nr:SDR family oxidoreductase [Acidimicrobiales bacterium]
MDKAKLSSLFDLTGRTAIVTGGSRGIGRAIAEGFAAAGANIVVASRKEAACVEAADAIRAAGGSAIAVGAHMGELDDLARVVDRTVDAFGGVDIVVNNAANALALPLGELTPEAWDKSFGVNLRGPSFLVQSALPHLIASEHGAVLNVISVGAFLFSPGKGMYSAGKAGLWAMTHAMAAELAPHGIRVNALAPGTVDTDMVRNTGPEAAASMAKASLMKRAADPDEMVGPALFLCSDAGSFVTGQCVVADGGMFPY